jgi:predicted nuclease of restriction endonuclease-like (RecB) superfamily
MKDFKQLSSTIEQIHRHLQANAASAVNQALTIRNFLVGYYIVKFEQNGEDRAAYGSNLLGKLAKNIAIKGLTAPELSRCRQFYQCYPQIFGSVTQKFYTLLPEQIVGTLPQDAEIEKVEGATNQHLKRHLQVPAEKIISKLSFTHLAELIKIDDPLKRTFYEIECIKGTWSVRELKRQLNSLYYERSGLSADPEKLAEIVHQNNSPKAPTDIIKNIYAFEFMDISTKAIIEESDLETALLDHLQGFIIELGNGFCLEARQKRILIGSTYYFIDLVFYHRILKCHVLVELKIGAFNHGDIGQLNTYLNYFKQEVSEANDNPPVGILLVAEKDHALVKYATAGMDENLFVQKYLVQLPGKDQLEKHIENELKKLQE